MANGDNLDVLRRQIATGSVDLIYLDPAVQQPGQLQRRRIIPGHPRASRGSTLLQRSGPLRARAAPRRVGCFEALRSVI
jgi:hypothetical protein